MATFTYTAIDSAPYSQNDWEGKIGWSWWLIQGGGANGNYGNAKSLLLFNSTQIRNDLRGYTVQSCTLDFVVHDVEGSSATIFIGTHNYTSLPNNYSSSRVATDRVRYNYSYSGQDKQVSGVNIGATIGQEFKDGVTTGIVFGPAPYNAYDNGAEFAPHNTEANWVSARPRLTIVATPSNVAPNPPALQSPGDNGIFNLQNQPTTFTWTHSDVNGDPMASYQFRRRVSGSSTYQYWTGSAWSGTATSITASGTNGSVTFPAGQWTNGTVYLWSVRTRDPGGLDSPWSAERTVYASTPPSASVTSPTGNVTVPRPTLNWTYSDPEGQGQYGWIVQVVPSEAYNAVGYNPDNYTGTAFSTSGTGTTNSLVSPVDLVNHKTYRAYVRVSSSPLPSSALQFSNWAFSTFTIVIPPYAPTMVYPQNGSIADLAAGFTMDWNNSFYGPGSQTAFAIRRITAGGSYQWWNGLNWSSGTEVWLSGTQTQYAFRPNEILNGVTYTFSVAIRDDYSQTSVYSPGATVTGSAQAQVTIISPQGTAITTQPLVQWSEYDPENDPQQTYQVRIIAESVFSGQGTGWNPGTATAVWDTGETVDPTTLVRSVVVSTNLTNGSTYRAYVRVKTGGVYSGWTYSEFSVQLIGPARPELVTNVLQEDGTIEIVIQGRDSFLDVATAGNFSGWSAETNCTLNNQVFFASSHSSRISTLSATATGAMAAQSTAMYPVYPGQIYTWATTISMATDTPGGGRQAHVAIEFLNAASGTVSMASGNTIVDDSAQRSVVTAAAPEGAVNARLHVLIIEDVPPGGTHVFFDPVFRPGTGGEWSPGGLVGLTKASVVEVGHDRLIRRSQNINVPTTTQVVRVRDEEPEIGEPETYRVTMATVYPGGAVLTSVPRETDPCTWTSGWLWLSDPLRPGTARAFGPQSLGEIVRPVRQGKHRPIGRADAVLTTGTRGLREGSFKLVTWTREERDAFQDLVATSGVLLLRIPPDQGETVGDTIYIRIQGDAPESRPLASRTPHRTIEQAWVEQYRPLDLLDWADEGI